MSQRLKVRSRNITLTLEQMKKLVRAHFEDFVKQAECCCDPQEHDMHAAKPFLTTIDSIGLADSVQSQLRNELAELEV